MQNGLKISVTMITYNGVRYIEEQLISILNQTVKPDEVIISDDGSTDGSIELIERIINNNTDSGIQTTLLTDNPKHGIGSNFSWAVQHTTGDIVFSAGQDDVWYTDKIERVLEVYYQYPEAKLVATDLSLIDSNNNPFLGKIDYIYIDNSKLANGEIIKLNREKYLPVEETVTLISGVVLSFKRELIELIIPIPVNLYEDQWIEFIGLAEDAMYFLNQKTTYYRLHDSINHSKNVSILRKLQRISDVIRHAIRIPVQSFCYGKEMIKYFSEKKPEDFLGKRLAVDTANLIVDNADTQLKLMKMNRFSGAKSLSLMYIKDERFRRSGFQPFIGCLLYIIRFSKKYRNNEINAELTKCGF